jgi:hypothetical protein
MTVIAVNSGATTGGSHPARDKLGSTSSYEPTVAYDNIKDAIDNSTGSDLILPNGAFEDTSEITTHNTNADILVANAVRSPILGAGYRWKPDGTNGNVGFSFVGQVCGLTVHTTSNNRNVSMFAFNSASWQRNPVMHFDSCLFVRNAAFSRMSVELGNLSGGADSINVKMTNTIITGNHEGIELRNTMQAGDTVELDFCTILSDELAHPIQLNGNSGDVVTVRDSILVRDDGASEAVSKTINAASARNLVSGPTAVGSGGWQSIASSSIFVSDSLSAPDCRWIDEDTANMYVGNVNNDIPLDIEGHTRGYQVGADGIDAPPPPATQEVTVAFGTEHAGSWVRLYVSELTGGLATLPFTPINPEKNGLSNDGLALAGEGRLDSSGKLTFNWWDENRTNAIAQVAVELVGGWVLSNPIVLNPA